MAERNWATGARTVLRERSNKRSARHRLAPHRLPPATAPLTQTVHARTVCDSRSDRTGEHHIVYDDGDDEYIVLACERIEWIDPPPAGAVYSGSHLTHGARTTTPAIKVSPPGAPRAGKPMSQTNFQQVRTPSVRALALSASLSLSLSHLPFPSRSLVPCFKGQTRHVYFQSTLHTSKRDLV